MTTRRGHNVRFYSSAQCDKTKGMRDATWEMNRAVATRYEAKLIKAAVKYTNDAKRGKAFAVVKEEYHTPGVDWTTFTNAMLQKEVERVIVPAAPSKRKKKGGE